MSSNVETAPTLLSFSKVPYAFSNASIISVAVPLNPVDTPFTRLPYPFIDPATESSAEDVALTTDLAVAKALPLDSVLTIPSMF